MTNPALPAARHLNVFAANDLFVTAGANLGDALGPPEDLCLGDVYQLDPAAETAVLALAEPRPGDPPLRQQVIADGGQIGAPGDPVVLAAQLVLMAPDGQQVELLLLRHRAAGRTAQATLYVLPLAPITPRLDYILLAATDPPAELRLADLLCLSFHRGTRIITAAGAAQPVEDLRPGDLLLTRDHGPQPLRWIGRTTLRARGAFAPVVITRGTLGNDSDLVVGPHHRLFRYRRDRLPGVKTAELLVPAQYLIDGETIYRREGGYAEYFSLVFDRHEIIYAEGIPVESLMVNEATVAALPDELATALRSDLPGLSQQQHYGTEADASLAQALRDQPSHRRRP